VAAARVKDKTGGPCTQSNKMSPHKVLQADIAATSHVGQQEEQYSLMGEDSQCIAGGGVDDGKAMNSFINEKSHGIVQTVEWGSTAVRHDKQ